VRFAESSAWEESATFLEWPACEESSASKESTGSGKWQSSRFSEQQPPTHSDSDSDSAIPLSTDPGGLATIGATGAVIAGTVVAVALLAAAIVIAFLLRRKQRTGGENEEEAEADALIETEAFTAENLYVTQEGLSHNSDAAESDGTDSDFLEVTEES
jgi:hypothetical protein